MHEIDRRSTLILGFATAGAAFLAEGAAAQPYRPDEGIERSPGVRIVNVSERASMAGRESVLPAYKRIVVRDIVYQPGAMSKSDSMMNDMICQCIDGEMRIDHRGGHAFTVKKGNVWTCVKGEPEDVANTGNSTAIMRVIDLLPA
jgi:quercetin dioxygenase-like cupin family protein